MFLIACPVSLTSELAAQDVRADDTWQSTGMEDRFWFPEEFRTFTLSFGASPLAACAAFDATVSARDEFEASERDGVTCGRYSYLGDPFAPECQNPEGATHDAVPGCNDDGIFFMARGTPDWTATMRFKLNASASRLEDQLSSLARTVTAFYQRRGWEMPPEVLYRIRQGLSLEARTSGFTISFSREIGVRPRFNLILKFAERPPFGLSFEATQDFRF